MPNFRRNTSEPWFGIQPNGQQVQIAHSSLMGWAHKHDMQYHCSWCDAVTMPDGTRLARTREAATARGWKDVAQAPFATLS